MFAVVKFFIPIPKIDKIVRPVSIPGIDNMWSLGIFLNPENINNDSEFKFLEVKPLVSDAPIKLGDKFTMLDGSKKIAEGEIVFNNHTQEEQILKDQIKKLDDLVNAYRCAAMEDLGIDATDKIAQLESENKELKAKFYDADKMCAWWFEKHRLGNIKIAGLEEAIKKHREQTGHNMCWENDEELWSVLKDGVVIDHTPPNWCEFMTKCAQYRASKDK